MNNERLKDWKMPSFFAHSVSGRAENVWEPLREHLDAVAGRAAEFAGKFGGAALGEALGLLHDLGKYDDRFQQRLRSADVRHDHSTAGAQLAVDLDDRIGKLLAYAVAGHHAGLADWEAAEGSRRGALSQRLKRDVSVREVVRRAEADGLSLPARLDKPPFKGVVGPLQGFQLAFLGRMLFSCLVDADFLETERFYDAAEGRRTERGIPVALPLLRERLDRHLTKTAAEAPDTPVNRLRGAVLAHVRAQAGRAPGIFTLTVPTGGGKTLTSLAFALDHAIRHGLDRVVYVIPFTSIVEQTANVFRKALAAEDGAVLEHHSAFDETKLGAREGRRKLELAAENWDVPVVVTTAVQFFESLFADRPSRCRKLHNLARSVVVLDEAQTLPISLLRPCVAALDELARNYRTSVVLCTATQPALEDTGDPDRSFPGGFRKPHELAPDVKGLFTALKRVTVEHAGVLSDEALADRLAAADQVLCIVNTRAHARGLFERLGDRPGTRHLSTLMCAAHRRTVLDEIRADLKDGRPCRVVSTSLIEAGVDIDFPLVYRAEAGLDAIAQAAGRCNREGERDPGASRTLVFEAEDKRNDLRSLRPYTEAGRAILRRGRDPLEPDAIEAYFREVYWRVGEAALDRPGIFRMCNEGASRLELPFEAVARCFRMIDDLFVPVIVPFGKAASLVATLPHAEHVGRIARELQPFTVGIPAHARSALLAAGAAEVVAPERFEEQFVWLVNEGIYDIRTGLDWRDPHFREAGSLFV